MPFSIKRTCSTWQTLRKSGPVKCTRRIGIFSKLDKYYSSVFNRKSLTWTKQVYGTYIRFWKHVFQIFLTSFKNHNKHMAMCTIKHSISFWTGIFLGLSVFFLTKLDLTIPASKPSVYRRTPQLLQGANYSNSATSTTAKTNPQGNTQQQESVVLEPIRWCRGPPKLLKKPGPLTALAGIPGNSKNYKKRFDTSTSKIAERNYNFRFR